MQMTRRSLLAGASALTLALFLPVTNATALDRDALEALARHVRKAILGWPRQDWDELFKYSMGRTFQYGDHEWLDERHVVEATDRTLRVAFRALEQAAGQGEYRIALFENGHLTFHGQTVVYHLPIAPTDYASIIFTYLNRLAPHYLTPA